MKKKSLLIILVVCLLLSGCSNNPQKEKSNIRLDDYSFDSDNFPEEIDTESINGEVIMIKSKIYGVSYSGIEVGMTKKEMDKKINDKFQPFYSIHSPDTPNIGWYLLNDSGDIIIFDFDLDDGLYYNENVNEKDTIKEIILTNVKYFD